MSYYKATDKQKKWWANNRERIREYKNKWYANNRQQDRKLKLKRKGWTLELVKIAQELQGNTCAICQESFTKTPASDHKHVSPPEARGLLCSICNKALGAFKDSPELLRVAADYVETWDAIISTKNEALTMLAS